LGKGGPWWGKLGEGTIFEEIWLEYSYSFNSPGGTLQELLTQQETLQLPWETYLNITLDVARGVAYLHHKGIIHRDLNSKVCIFEFLIKYIIV
jgi:serine/threonine protein kinase